VAQVQRSSAPRAQRSHRRRDRPQAMRCCGALCSGSLPLVLFSGAHLLASAAPWTLPGNHFLGEPVVSTITWKNEHGHIEPGDVGHVVGRATVEPNFRIRVSFPSLKDVNIQLREITTAGIVFMCSQRGRCHITSDSARRKARAVEVIHSFDWFLLELVKPLLGLCVVLGMLYFGAQIGKRLLRDLAGHPSPEYECSFCMEVLIDPVYLPCGHTSCSHCLKEWWYTRPGRPAVLQTCPVGNCQIGLRSSPPVIVKLRGVIESRYPRQVAERRARLFARQNEDQPRFATYDLDHQLASVFSEKGVLDIQILKKYVQDGADVMAKSMRYSQDSLMLVLLNSKHLREQDVLEAMEIFTKGKNYNLAEHEEELRSLLWHWSVSQAQGRWVALSQIGHPEATWRLSSLVDKACKLRQGIDIDAMTAFLREGARADSKCLHYNRESLLEVVLACTHLPRAVVAAAAACLTEHGAQTRQEEAQKAHHWQLHLESLGNWDSAERPLRLLEEQSKHQAEYATKGLDHQLARGFREKGALNMQVLKRHIQDGADVMAKSTSYTQDSLMLVLLNSRHLRDQDVLEAMEIFTEGKDYTLTEHQEELESLLKRLSLYRELGRWGDLLLKMGPPGAAAKLRSLVDEAHQHQRAIDTDAVRAVLGEHAMADPDNLPEGVPQLGSSFDKIFQVDHGIHAEALRAHHAIHAKALWQLCGSVDTSLQHQQGMNPTDALRLGGLVDRALQPQQGPDIDALGTMPGELADGGPLPQAVAVGLAGGW